MLLAKFCVKHREVDVLLHRGVLAWRDVRTRSSDISNTSGAIQVCEIVAVQETEEGGLNKAEVGRTPTKHHVEIFPHGFKVFYVTRTRRHRWRCSDVTFHSADGLLCKEWVNVINGQLWSMTNRPKTLLVYINPYGGKQCGKLIYEQKVAPLFRRACISADVIVTERANHAREHLNNEADLDKYDGIVCVGGDGMFSEILHGLVTRTQKDHNIDLNQCDANFIPSSLRIGIIPAGSTDCICFATVGTNDPVTSALHIIIGDSQPMDVCAVHHDNTFLRCSVSLLGYGFYGDMLTDSERMRWLGPARYDLSGVKTFLSLNNYEGTVSFLPAEDDKGNPRDEHRCRAGCGVCQHSNSSENLCSGTSEECEKPNKASRWVKIRGRFIAINAASMSCACPRSPQGLSPAAHLADGTTDLILVHKCSRLDFLRHLFRHTNKDDQFDHPFVEVHRVQRFRFEPRHSEAVSVEDLSDPQNKVGFSPICLPTRTCDFSPAQSNWSCDGEILPHTAIQVSVQRQLIRLFARGIEDQQQCLFEEPCSLWARTQEHMKS
ncbi:ceramide kinase isoform X1 [Synchiropus splendidus]|uniref:ceramide kinase isoform X1 n=1 Tax=Synchiropus splendidus TaxID=270530 RepID=UPI00237E913C|nr:ceramide kinase isoform X1 [Synchiropus splendidus]